MSHEEPPPSERPEGGWDPLARKMEAMAAEADVVIAAATSASGEPVERFRDGELRIHFAMRPEFGPANAALPREKKIDALALAVGIEPADAPRLRDRADPDAFVAAVRAAIAAFEGEGWAVEHDLARAREIGWTPDERGWRIRVTDRARTVDELVPYAGTPAGPPASGAAPRQVHPTVTVWFFPVVPMGTTRIVAERAQPARVAGALPGAVLFRRSDLPSPDQDPKDALGSAMHALLFPAAPAQSHDGDLARALGTLTAEVRDGLLSVTGSRDLPPAAPRPAGVHALHQVLHGGMKSEERVAPLDR